MGVFRCGCFSMRLPGLRNIHFGSWMACGTVKGGYLATCAAVKVDHRSRELKALRLMMGFGCENIINPGHLKRQLVGCRCEGLGRDLFEAVDLKDERILNPCLSTYRVPGLKDVPEVELVLLDRRHLPSSSAGEALTIGVAPAIREAILDARGIKFYKLPMLPSAYFRRINLFIRNFKK